MSSHIANKIEAKDKNLSKLLSDERFKIDVFQREYRWERKHIEDLISDLSLSFLANYSENHNIEECDEYDSYYMGPVVLCQDKGSLSIVDGQQRLTSFTLLLIYLHHLQTNYNIPDSLSKEFERYLYVSKSGRKTLILDIDSREDVINHLFNNHDIPFQPSYDDESVKNIIDRYEDIVNLFPEEIKNTNAIPIFIEWLLFKVVFVEVRAFSMENAYTIFETMNDRGLNLSPTEMLKGYLLTKIKDDEKSLDLNDFWKKRIRELRNEVGPDSDLEFFRAWLRAKYAETIRQSRQGAENKDFELIGTQFHAWVRSNSPKRTGLEKPDDFYFFIQSDFDYYSQVYTKVYKAKAYAIEPLKLLYINNFFTIADSLSFPLFLSPITKLDTEPIVSEKLYYVAKFIDVYTNVRSITGKPITQSSIRVQMYELVKAIRNLERETLFDRLREEIQKLGNHEFYPEFNILDNFNYYHYFFARIMYFLNEGRGDFNSLLRSRRHNSYILYRIFNEDDLGGYYEHSTMNLHNTVANFCLIRRFDYDKIEALTGLDRIAKLVELNYLPEYNHAGSDIIDFITARDIAIKRLAEHIWSFDE